MFSAATPEGAVKVWLPFPPTRCCRVSGLSGACWVSLGWWLASQLPVGPGNLSVRRGFGTGLGWAVGSFLCQGIWGVPGREDSEP